MKHYYFCALVNDDAYLEDGCLYFEGEPNLVLQKRDDDGNILAEKEITKSDLDTNDSTTILKLPNTYNELSKELKDKMFDVALQYQSEWAEDSDEDIRLMAEDDSEAVAEMLYDNADNDTRQFWLSK